jgi:uncharacterized protein (TIGR00251 family)
MTPKARLTVKAAPRASADRLTGRSGATVRIALAAPPVDGEANKRLLKFLAKTLGVRAAALSLAAGASGRTKIVEIAGLEQAELAAKLDKLLPAADAPTVAEGSED